jgi:glutathione S-transferase
VTYALQFGTRNGGVILGEAEQAYVARTTGRDRPIARAMDACHATRSLGGPH